MTRGQLRCLNVIRSYVAQHGYSPSYEDICAGMGLKSKSGVHRFVHALIESGHLKVERRAGREIGSRALVAAGECPYCGRQPT